MKKEQILQVLDSAKKDIANMLENARLIKEGMPLQYHSIAKNPKECDFGKWFYSDGQKLSALSNNPMECIQNIDLLHNEFHKTYHEIVSIYENNKKSPGLLKKIFSKKELTQEEKQKLHDLTRELENSCQKLLAEITKMQRRIQATPQEKFEAIE